MVVKLQCTSCDTSITGKFFPCEVCRLEGEARDLFDLFLKVRGNLKAMERELKVSYPTVRLKVEELFTELGKASAARPNAAEILRMLRDGKITVDEAEELLRSS